jgi:hypothetical protein
MGAKTGSDWLTHRASVTNRVIDSALLIPIATPSDRKRCSTGPEIARRKAWHGNRYQSEFRTGGRRESHGISFQENSLPDRFR